MDKFGLTSDTIEIINNLFKKFIQINEVKIFGSRARGNFKPTSDIDFALYGENIDDKLIRHISAELDELPTPYKFDILDYNSINNSLLRASIDEIGKTFYKRGGI